MKVEGGAQDWTLLEGKSDYNCDNFLAYKSGADLGNFLGGG